MSLKVQGFNYFLNLIIMKKSILNIGKALNRIQQKLIIGGEPSGNQCNEDNDCITLLGYGRLPWVCDDGYCTT